MMVLTAGWFLASFFVSPLGGAPLAEKLREASLTDVQGQIFSSKPVSLGWQSPVHNAMNYPAFLVSIATINTALDLATVCLPLLVILKLNMTFNRKVLVSGMFLLGLFCIIASAVRLYYFVYLLQEANNPVLETSVTVDDTIWSFIEPCMSIVAACLPTLAPVFKGGRDLGSIVRSVRSVFSLRTIDSQKDQIRSKGSKESKGSNTQETREAKRAWQKLNTGTSPSNHIAGGSEVELDEIRPLYDPASGITVQTTLTSEVSKDGLV
ncbi:hypothetical protein MMC18_004490 [Xylographa bjoerkii]|nr:hypothetical protein [Xylographa bjoerkii]